VIVTYQSYEVPYIWDKVKPFIELALDQGSNWTLDEILVALCNQKAQLWTWQNPNIQAAMVTTIQDDYLLILTIGGTGMREWFRYLRLVEDWARDKGLKRLKIHGRKGWARFGFKVDSVGEQYEMSKEL